MERKNGRLFFIFVVTIAIFSLFAGSPLAASKKVVFADLNWDSAQVHNRIAGHIIQHGFGYKVEYIPGGTIPLFAGLSRGDVDINMECWVENQQEAYDKAIAAGKVIDLGSNYPDSWQGWLVPTYVIKGDPKRGIQPMAPDLKSVFDMPKYWKLFQDPEYPSKGRFYSCIPGWECEKINEKKFKAYGLDRHYNIFLPGSDAALNGSMAAAYEKRQPWFGYYWAPTWVLGKLDMTPLEEPKYDEKVWKENYACAYPSVRVNILVHSDLPKKAPDVVEFLKKYETTQGHANKFLAYMRDTKGSSQDAAVWFLKNYQSLWTQWVSPQVASKVKAALP
ncbi:MAG: ABC transporter substrate-binding protein [Deltaproteobacteria bacterium]|nr:ABC transporter substrate-binding protein [Deltaproteobacteria bacterium]MBW2135971.1 ABC transporter substrate-binding protein [Deltaproteobacteria bacterium]